MNRSIMISSDSTHYRSIVFNQVRLVEFCLIAHSCLVDVYTGYRHVHLYTIGGDLIANAYLFVHIVINSKSLAVVSFLV
jgi:hypothetical protein